MKFSDYDLIIIGGGPAGLTAGVYAARGNLRTLLLEKMVPGGQALNTFMIENYPGFPEGISGPDLTLAMENQAKKFGVEIVMGEVNQLTPQGRFWELEIEGRKTRAKAIILATGAEPTKLGLPGEEEFKGRGVSYCATCDGPFFRDQEVGVVGGGDTAVEEALYLTRFARRVFLIHRRDSLRAEKILQDRAFRNSKIEILWDTVVTKILGENAVKELEIKNVKTQLNQRLMVNGVFFYVGLKPAAEFIRNIAKLDEKGYVITDENMATSACGIFAAGDVRKKLLRQVATAIGDGAAAAFAVERYIESLAFPS